MRAKDKTEEVLKSIHVLFSKAEHIEGSKKKVIIDRDHMMSLLKELNDCMYAMMDEYEISSQSKEKALRRVQKKSDEIIFDARKNAEDIYAASIMYTDHALDEIQSIIDKTRDEVSAAHRQLEEQIDKKKQALKDNQIDLKNSLSSLIDTQKYLMLIENENKRLQYESEKQAEVAELGDDKPKKIVPEIRINEEYFKQAGLLEETDSDKDVSEEEIDPAELEELDNEYFQWKEENEGKDGTKQESKKGLFGLGRK